MEQGINQCWKKRYASAKHAMRLAEHIEKTRGTRLRVYYCGLCQGHHLTKRLHEVEVDAVVDRPELPKLGKKLGQRMEAWLHAHGGDCRCLGNDGWEVRLHLMGVFGPSRRGALQEFLERYHRELPELLELLGGAR